MRPQGNRSSARNQARWKMRKFVAEHTNNGRVYVPKYAKKRPK